MTSGPKALNGLNAVSETLARRVDDGTIPGAVVLVAVGGEVIHLEAQGHMDLAPERLFEVDTIYWLASLSKPIIATAILMLAQEGKLTLADELSVHIPAFAEPARVRIWDRPPPAAIPFGPPPDDLPGYRLEPAQRPLRIEDLLTHTGGLQSIFVYNPDMPWPVAGETLSTYVPKLGSVPLDFQPGTQWAYSNAASFDVLSHIIEIASGESLRGFLQTRIFDPLGMSSAGFGATVDRARAMPLDGPFAANPTVVGDSFQSGSAGLWMSAEDYYRFAEMLLSDGTSDGQTLLTPESIREMTTNRVGDLMKALSARADTAGLGFGLAVATIEDAEAAAVSLSNGSFGWDGIATRRFWASPAEHRFLFMYVPDPGVQAEVEAAVAEALS